MESVVMFEWWYFSLEREVNMTGKPDRGIEALNSLATKAQDAHFRRHNMLYLESAICCTLQQDNPFEVAAILVRQADELIANI